MPPLDPTCEIFDVVDTDDRVIGQASRAEVHARGLLHRAVHMFVFNSDGKLLIHQRSASKDEYPLLWTSSASGHVDAGESYEVAAIRELQEELGLDAPLEYLFTERACPDTANEHSALYRVRTDDPPVPDPGEIQQIAWVTLDEVRAELHQGGERYTPPFRVLASRLLEDHT